VALRVGFMDSINSSQIARRTSGLINDIRQVQMTEQAFY
jgi:hypothetical protein